MVLEMSSVNCHLRWNDCCGTLVLVPNEALGNTTSGALMLLSIRLFQYWNPAVNWFTVVSERTSST